MNHLWYDRLFEYDSFWQQNINKARREHYTELEKMLKNVGAWNIRVFDRLQNKGKDIAYFR